MEENLNVEKPPVTNQRKRTTLVIIILLLLVGISVIGLNYLYDLSSSRKEPVETLTEADISGLPDFAVRNLPIEAGAIVKNQTVDINENRHEVIRTYTSTTSMAEIFSAYKKYIKATKLPVLSEIDKPDLKSISAGYPNTAMFITVTINKTPDASSKVSIIFDYVTIPAEKIVPTTTPASSQ